MDQDTELPGLSLLCVRRCFWTSVLQIEQPPPGLPAGSPSSEEKSGRTLLKFVMAGKKTPKSQPLSSNTGSEINIVGS